MSAIFALGVVGAGTNNARLAQMLRQLALYYHKDSNCLFAVRLAQGLVHLAKGTASLQPWLFAKSTLCPSAFASLLATVLCFTDQKTSNLFLH